MGMMTSLEFDAEQMVIQDDLLIVCGDDQQVVLPCDYTGRVMADYFHNGWVAVHVQANSGGVTLEWVYR